MNADPNGMTGEKENNMFYYIYKDLKKTFNTADEANAWLKTQNAYRSIINDQGEKVAWINSKYGEESKFIVEETKTEETKTETKAEDIKKAVKEKAAEDMTGKKVTSKKEAIFEEETEEKPEEAKEENMDVMNLAGQATIIIGKLAEMAAANNTTATTVKTVKVEDTSKIDALKAEIETMKKTAATWQSKATKAEAEKAEAVKSWHVCAGELVKAQAKIDELIEAAKAMKPVKKIFTVKRVKSATEDTATAADKYAECPWDEDIEETTEETTEETNADEDAEEDYDDLLDYDEHEEIPVPNIDKYLDKNGVPFAFKGKCIFAITEQEKSLFTMDDCYDYDKMMDEYGYAREGQASIAEKVNVTKLICEEHTGRWENGNLRVFPRQWELIWEGPIGEFDDPAFKHIRTVTCRDYRDPETPDSILYSDWQYVHATEEEREIMRKEQEAADNSKDSTVEQVGFTGTSDGRIHFYKGYKGFSETYTSFDQWAKKMNNTFYFANDEEKISRFKNYLRDFSQPISSKMEQVQDVECDRAFVRCVIDHFDPRVAREIKKQDITFSCPYDMLNFKYVPKTNLCYSEGMSEEEIEEISRERRLFQLSEYGLSARNAMYRLCNAIDAAKVRLHMTDYVGTAR